MTNTPVLEIRDLSKTFVLHERGATLTAFRDVAASAWVGRMTVLVGASGSGKSSVLKCVHRTYRSDAGVIEYRSESGERIDLASVSEQRILELRRREIRFVSQFLHALPRKGAIDVVARPLRELGEPADAARDRANEALSRLGFPERLRMVPPATFSGGERQLVNLARAIVVEPRLLLLDEPTASLDPRSTERIVEALEGLKERRIAMLAVFHDRNLVDRLSDERLEMRGGMAEE